MSVLENTGSKIKASLDAMDPDLKGQLLTALIGAGAGGIMGGVLSGSHVGESPGERRMRLLKNALLGTLLGGAGGFGLSAGVKALSDAAKPREEDVKEDYGNSSLIGYLSAGGAGVGSGYLANKMMGGGNPLEPKGTPLGVGKLKGDELRMYNKARKNMHNLPDFINADGTTTILGLDEGKAFSTLKKEEIRRIIDHLSTPGVHSGGTPYGAETTKQKARDLLYKIKSYNDAKNPTQYQGGRGWGGGIPWDNTGQGFGGRSKELLSNIFNKGTVGRTAGRAGAILKLLGIGGAAAGGAWGGKTVADYLTGHKNNERAYDDLDLDEE
jgi:hypothetical protein